MGGGIRTLKSQSFPLCANNVLFFSPEQHGTFFECRTSVHVRRSAVQWLEKLWSSLNQSELMQD